MDTTIQRLLADTNPASDKILPFLWLHGEPAETLREYMQVIHNAHIGAVCVESRPHPDFLGPKWWQDLDVILAEAERLQMKVWILDDSHFPTGYANGALQNAEETLCRQSLVYRLVTTVEAGENVELSLQDCAQTPPWTPNMMEQYTMDLTHLRHFADDRFVGAVAVKTGGCGKSDLLDLTASVKAGSCHFTAPAGQWRVYALNLTRNRGPHRNYINMMCQESCKVLLDTVYEAHWQHYSRYFGNTIAGFFSDEPEIGNGHLYESGKRIWEVEDQAWSAEVEQELTAHWGNDFVRLLPLLWAQDFDGKTAAEVRLAYMNAVTNAVKRDFSDQIGDWCRAHGVAYIGHLIEDNNQHLRCGSSLGHYFRGLDGQDMAGIDCIGGQALPQGEWNGPYGLMGQYRNGLFYQYVLAKLGSSLAAVDPKKQGRCMCEIFGNYGWEEGVRLEKYLTDHFLVRGVNHFVPHAFSPKAFPDPDCPPHFYAHGHNPQYRHFGALMAYMGRMCSLFSDGRRNASTAILYNAEADWMGDCMALETVAQPLTDNQIDFDFIPLDVFAEPAVWNTQIKKGLQVNRQHYTTLLIPGCEYLPDDTAKILTALQENGCEVFFIEKKPRGMESTVIDVQQISCVATREINLQPNNDRIRCMHYSSETERYLFVNEGTQCYTGTITVPTKGSCYLYDAWANCIEVASAKSCHVGTEVAVSLYPGKSMVLVFDETDSAFEPPMPSRYEDISAGWTRSICSSTEYPQFKNYALLNLPDNLAKEKPLFSGFVRYEKDLELDSSKRYLLEITDAYEGVEVFVNGRSLGIQIVPPFVYELPDSVKPGKNNIVIEVATTLEREMATQPDPIRQHLGLGNKEPTCPSGINGCVRLWEVKK